MPWLVGLWLAGVAGMSLWHAGGWIALQRLKSLAARPAGADILARLTQLKGRLAITRPVRIAESAIVKAPIVAGWLYPVILLPAAVATGLSSAQLEAILAHELAHIRRHDYLANMLQVVIETLMFYHPAIWWLSRRVRIEREHCCDDIAVAVCGNRIDYAEALTNVAEMRLAGAALAAGGANKQELLARIGRLLGAPGLERTPRAGLLAGVLIPVTLAVIAIGMILPARAEGPNLITPQEKPTTRSISRVVQPTSAPADAPQVNVETWFIEINAKDIPASVLDLATGHSQEPWFDDETAQKLRQMARSVTIMPKVTVSDGGRAQVDVSTETAYADITATTRPDGTTAYQTKPATVWDGVRVDVTASISQDRKYVHLLFNPERQKLLKLDAFEIKPEGKDQKPIRFQAPVLQKIDSNIDTTVPDGATLYLGGQKTQGTDERTGEVYQAALLILVKPTITLPTGPEKTFPLLESRKLDKSENAAATQPQNASTPTIKVRTVDVDGKPIEGVNISASICSKQPTKIVKRDCRSDAAGSAIVELLPQMYILRIWTNKDGHVPTFTHWEPDWFEAGKAAPDEVTITLTKGTSIGGFVKNEEGQPIAGAKIGVTADDGRERQSMVSRWLATGDDDPTTDANGRWTLNNVPEGNPELMVSVTHPDYVSDLKWGGLQREQNVTTASLREQTATIVMRRGTSLTGQVTDPQGKGIAGAIVVWGDNPYDDTGMHQEHRQEVRTDAKGIYRLQPLPRMPLTVTVIAEGWMPELKRTTIAPETSKLDFQLREGKTLRLRFVDGSAKPIPDVYVGIEGWRGCKALYNTKHPIVLETPIPRSADKNGVFLWSWAPDDEVQYQFWKEGYSSMAKSVTADDTEQIIQLAH